MAFFFIPLVTTTLSSIEPERIPATPGLSNFVLILADSFGISMTTTVWQNRASIHHVQLSEFVSPGVGATNDVMSGLAGAGLTPEQALGSINRLVDQQADMLAANDVFYASAVVFLAKKNKVSTGSADAAAGAH